MSNKTVNRIILVILITVTLISVPAFFRYAINNDNNLYNYSNKYSLDIFAQAKKGGHHHSDGGASLGGDIPTITSGKNSNDFVFTEFLEVSPNLNGVGMAGPTNRFVDSGGMLHIVGELRNDGTKTANVNQMVATLYGPNNQTLGLDYANPIPAMLSPGQSASFELLVGGDPPIDGISDLSQITMVKYHLGY